MKIEKGKFYKTRDGRKVEILKTDAKNIHPIVGLITYSDDDELCAHWSDNGMHLKSAEDHRNYIIGEWEEVLDFDPYCLPKWADQWIAMDADGGWHCFSKNPTPEEGYYQMWCTNLRGEASFIPARFRPKNYTGNWKDSLFNVEQLKKNKSCQYK